ncbi:sec-independent protein translocase protein TatC [Stackebrandtia endophytica]|uniref:Sec-independent protein translocase protein TatC n=1 Tax=Stackebrandtia endophytica TaxID=1496996 RepID=A0A543AR02_9ACTN|nr:twin-arginine translocase subunit TatC [Stackebrandtia endophytica]TQL75010.1 sec-independent protein translocase protein TatC [Stackebrandtia endophytica]
MAFTLRRKKKSTFQRASDGSMTLMDHLRDLRNRLLKASIAVLLGLIACFAFAEQIQDFINAPYCDFYAARWEGEGEYQCDFNVVGPLDNFLLYLKIALFAGVLVSSPVWLYQLWAFIAPGLHKHERRYTYAFVAVAAPLFLAGATLGFFVISKSLEFFLQLSDNYSLTVDLTGYFDFVTNVMLLFGAGFQFPLIVILLNVIGLASAKRLLSWWRVATFLVFLFCAIVTPTPDPFGMTFLALPMVGLYFAAVGFAFLNDKRRAKKNNELDDLDPDQASVIDETPVDVGAPAPIEEPSTDPVDDPGRNRRYDDDAT